MKTAGIASLALALCLLGPAEGENAARRWYRAKQNGTAQRDAVVPLLRRTEGFTFLNRLLRSAEFDRNLGGYGPYTLFAPNDAAFQKLPERTRKALLSNRQLGAYMLMFHSVRSEISLPDLQAAAARSRGRRTRSFPTLLHWTLSVTVPPPGARGEVRVGSARVGRTIVAANGLIHEVDEVLPILADPPVREGIHQSLPREISALGLGRYRAVKGR